MTNISHIVAPAKLKNGSWGVTTVQTLSLGEIVTVKTRAGKTWDAQIVAHCGSTKHGALYATGKCQSAKPSATRTRYQSRTTRTGCACGSRLEGEVLVGSQNNCMSCRHDHE